MADGRLMTGSTHGPGSEYVTGGTDQVDTLILGYGPRTYTGPVDPPRAGGTFTPDPFFIPAPEPAYVREGVPSGGGGWVSVDPPQTSYYLIPPPGSEESGTGDDPFAGFAAFGAPTPPPTFMESLYLTKVKPKLGPKIDYDGTPTSDGEGDGGTVAGGAAADDWWIDICSFESGYTGYPTGPFGEPDTEGLPWRSGCLFKLTWSPKPQRSRYW